MKAACSHCGTEHVLRDAEVAAHAKVQFHCSRCRQTTVVEIELRPDRTMVISPLPSFARANASSSNLRLPPEDPSMKLPAQAAVVLTVTAGPGKGETHTISKPRVVLGRRGADVALKDPEISRHHCLLEVRDTYINLKDMDSTNGTFFDEERVRAAMLQDGSEFRVGTTVIRVNFRPK
jgi:Inner membrane component of T3SS, cytoplasmic domain